MWGASCAPAGGHMGPPLQRTSRVKRRTNGRGKPPPYRGAFFVVPDDLGGRRAGRPVVAAYRGASPDARRTTGEHQGRRVSAGNRNSPLGLPHSGNGRENGDASEVTPRRYICAGLSNQALPQMGSGG